MKSRNLPQKLVFILFCSAFLFTSCMVSRNVEVSKVNGSLPSGGNEIVYALPLTGLHVTLELTKTSFKKGPYAEYAQKYLGLTNVSLWDSESWTISDINIESFSEPDPQQTFVMSFKSYPANLSSLFTLTGKGMILDMANSWQKSYNQPLVSNEPERYVFDTNIIKETTMEMVDTTYKTVITDSTAKKIPVYKKYVIPKTTEDLAKEAANEIIKTRKRRIKIIRGEYDFHPDGAALAIMLKEMKDIEEKDLALFTGVEKTTKIKYSFVVYPPKDLSAAELGYFSEDKGWSAKRIADSKAITIQFVNKKSGEVSSTEPANKAQNVIYFRVPQTLQVIVMENSDEISSTSIPFYQFGPIRSLPLEMK